MTITPGQPQTFPVPGSNPSAGTTVTLSYVAGTGPDLNWSTPVLNQGINPNVVSTPTLGGDPGDGGGSLTIIVQNPAEGGGGQLSTGVTPAPQQFVYPVDF